jgi:hypothetical protein
MVTRISAKEGNTRTKGTCIPRRCSGIRLYTLYFIHVQTKFFGYDHGHNGITALSDIVCTGKYNSVSFAVQPYDSSCRAVMRSNQSSTGHKSGSGEANRLTASLRISPTILPANLFCAGIHTFFETAGCKFQTSRTCVIWCDLIHMS